MDKQETLALVSLMKQRDIMLAALQTIATADCTGICGTGLSAAYVAKQALTEASAP